ncbi:UNVERIFIED_CONTAM: hypothetical protein RMT77_015224 [Armadillidium vulgare]
MARTSSYQWIENIGGIHPWFSDERNNSDDIFQFPEIEPSMKIPAILLTFLYVLSIVFEYFDVEILQYVLSVNFNLLGFAFIYGGGNFILRKLFKKGNGN